jgi:two-component system OmpR family response regulator
MSQQQHTGDKEMPQTILIVEDNNGFSRILKTEIEHAGIQAIVVDNGVDGVMRYLDGDIDLVLMDVVMPKLSGIDTLRILKKIDPNVSAVVFSGNASNKIKEEALELGAIDFLIKPFSLGGLMEIIKAA